MSNKDEDGETDDELFVYADFGGLLDEDVLDLPNLEVKLIGLDTNKPMLQLGGQVFEGTYDDTMGTAVIFEEDDKLCYRDPVFDMQPSTNLKYLCKTNKLLNMERIFIEPKSQVMKKVPPESKNNLTPAAPTYTAALEALRQEAAAMGISEPVKGQQFPFQIGNNEKVIKEDGSSRI